ncbi:MAG: hypothetical protein KGI75_29235 [Rhizobiaceae bacterium]|nr:hypothetical protein [Rhizobiaceae bacterium]
MFKKALLSVSIAAFAGSALIPASFAQAQGFDRPPLVQNADWHGNSNDDWKHHHDHGHDYDHDHHHHNGGAIAGGLAAGLIGGVVGGALANGGGYYEPPTPPRRCWYESQRVENEYDPGWHYERVRVCD